MRPPCLVAFDTSSERLLVAVVAGDRIATLDEEGGAKSSARLLPAVEALLARAGVGRHDLDAIAFGRGPGAFTGLRTACAAAQGLGLGLDRPVLALDSLLVVADDTRAAIGAADVWVAMDARMDEVYAARYRWQAAGSQAPGPQGPAAQGSAGHEPAAQDPARQGPAAQGPGQEQAGQQQAAQELAGQEPAAQGSAGQEPGRQRLRRPEPAAGGRAEGRWAVVVEPALWPVAALSRAWGEAPPACVTGSALTAFAGRLATGDARLDPLPHDRAAALARLARAAFEAGEGTDAASALPLYLRDKVALTMAERAARPPKAQR